MDSSRIIKYCDKTMEICLYILIFCLPFSKALIEISASIAITAWFIKRAFSQPVYAKIALKTVGGKFLSILKKFRPIKTDLNIPFLAFIVVSLFSLINSNYIGKSLEAIFFRWTEYILLYFIIIETINNRKRLKNIISVMLLSAGIIGIDGIIQYFTGTDLIRRQPLVYDYATASFGHFNTFAMYLGGIIPIYLCLVLFGLRNKWMKCLMSLAAIILITSLALTSSRGGWFSFLATLVFIAVLKDKRMLIGIVIFLCISPFILPNPIKERIASTFSIDKNTGKLAVSDSGRNVMWKGAIEMIKERPLLGHGLNTFMYNYPKYKTDKNIGSELAHNCYLMITAEGGLIGLAVFIWIIVALFKSSFSCLRRLKQRRKQQSGRLNEAIFLGIFAGIFANLMHSFVDNNLQTLQTATLFWFLVGLVVALQRIVVSEPLLEK